MSNHQEKKKKDWTLPKKKILYIQRHREEMVRWQEEHSHNIIKSHTIRVGAPQTGE